MGKCPNCQKRSFRARRCSICGREGCEGCFIFLFSIVNKRKARLQNLYACSQNCLEILSKNIEQQISPSDIIPDEKMPPINYFVERAILRLDSAARFNQFVTQELRNKNPLHVFFHPFDNLVENPDNSLWKGLARYTNIIKATHYETMREFENAAKIYKNLGMYEDAGRVRAKSNELVVKKTDISLDLNALLQQVKNGGIVAVYRCPHCGGILKIGNKTDSSSLRICEHCGNEIKAVDLADFLKTALS